MVRESLVYPEEIVLGESFVASLKAIYAEVKSLQNVGVGPFPDSVISFASGWQEESPQILLIPSKPIEVDRRLRYSTKATADPLNEPIILRDLTTNILKGDIGGLMLTGVAVGKVDDDTPHWDHITFNPDEHTIAIVK